MTIPKNQTVQIILIFLIFFIIIFFYSEIKGLLRHIFGMFFTGGEEKLKSALEAGGTQYNYELWADAIYTAGNANFGTDEEAIYQVFEALRDETDLKGLVAAFGTRRLEFSIFTVNLGGYLKSELNSDELSVINTILKNKNINFQF